jgi:MFS family permease
MSTGAKRLLTEQPRLSKSHWLILFYAWSGWLFDFYDLTLYNNMLRQIRGELGLSDVQAYWVLGASLVATALGGMLFGYLADRIGRKPALSLTVLIYSLGTGLCATATSVATLLLWRIVTGLGVGGEWAVGQMLIAETFPRALRARGGAMMQTGVPAGMALAAAIANFVTPRVGWRWTFALSAMPALMVAGIRHQMPESDLWQRHHAAFRRGALPAEVQRELGRSPLTALFSADMATWTMRALLLAVFDMWAFWIINAAMPSLLGTEWHYSDARRGVWLLVQHIGAFIGYLSFGWVADGIGRRQAFTGYMLVQGGAVALLCLFVPSAHWLAHPILALLPLFLIGLGTGAFSGYGPLYAEIFPTHLRTTAAGLCFNVARATAGFAPPLVALLAQDVHYTTGMLPAALFNLLVAGWIWTFPETKGRALPDSMH